jgi:hypothetical protein
MRYEYKYAVFIVDEKNASMKEMERLLKEGWEPVRETGLPSSGSNYSENAQLPSCLCVLRRQIDSESNQVGN